RKQAMEVRRQVPPGDDPAGGGAFAHFRVPRRFAAFAGFDRAKNTIGPPRRDRDDGDAERDADPVPADPLVAEHRRSMQRIEHFALTILWSRLHRSTRHATSRQLPAPPISSLQRPMSNPTPRRPPERAFRADGRQRLAKRAHAREGLRGDRSVLCRYAAQPSRRPPWPSLAI